MEELTFSATRPLAFSFPLLKKKSYLAYKKIYIYCFYVRSIWSNACNSNYRNTQIVPNKYVRFIRVFFARGTYAWGSGHSLNTNLIMDHAKTLTNVAIVLIRILETVLIVFYRAYSIKSLGTKEWSKIFFDRFSWVEIFFANLFIHYYSSTVLVL